MLLTLKVKGVSFRILPLSLNKDTSNVLQKLKFYAPQHIVATEIWKSLFRCPHNLETSNLQCLFTTGIQFFSVNKDQICRNEFAFSALNSLTWIKTTEMQICDITWWCSSVGSRPQRRCSVIISNTTLSLCTMCSHLTSYFSAIKTSLGNYFFYKQAPHSHRPGKEVKCTLSLKSFMKMWIYFCNCEYSFIWPWRHRSF